MKVKFTSLDIKSLVAELEKKLLGMRVNNVYDIDSKTYLIKLNRTDEKAILLLESGIRLHTTEFEWPKNIIPSGFAMKLRKHLRGRRLESLKQLGVDRIVDMQFGSGEAAYHVILEMYDRGNVVLTDHEYIILNIQRPRADNNQDVKFVVKEKYPIHLARQHHGVPTKESIIQLFEDAKKGDNLRKILNPHLVYGSFLLEHCLLNVGLEGTAKLGTEFEVDKDLEKLMEALNNAEEFMQLSGGEHQKGYIINRRENKVGSTEAESILIYTEFHPHLLRQHLNELYTEFESFDKAVDEFFSKIESQKQDRKLLQQESAALKKLDHIKLDNQQRIGGLKEEQLTDLRKACLIELNLDMVDEAISVMRGALAHQLDWTELKQMVEEAACVNNVVGSIKALKLDINHITMLLKPPESVAGDDELQLKPSKVDIDLGISAHANARKYYDMKRHAAVKETKTSDALQKAYKSVEKKTLKVLKEVQTVATINKARKTHWFEKFLWFISSENYVVIGGRDQQQNEFIVKRHLKQGDIYVHADLHGASSVVIKNPTRNPVPPVTLNEAGTMALCNSAAWDARVVTSSWWVYHDQVSKTAPTGEYLTTGSFMIRGKKNYLLPSTLIYGFGFLFKLDEPFVDGHKNERRTKGTNEDGETSQVTETSIEEELQDNGPSDDEVESASDELQLPKLKTSDDDRHEKSCEEMVCGEEVTHVDDDGEEEDEEDNRGVELPDNEDGKDDDDDLLESFPDTHIRMDHLISLASSDVQKSIQADEDSSIKKHKTHSKQRDTTRSGKGSGNKGPNNEEKDADEESSCANASKALKRGQRGKLKKIKEKYADQDEGERELRMQLLASDGPRKEVKKKSKKDLIKQKNLIRKQAPVTKQKQVHFATHLEAGVEPGIATDEVIGTDSKQAELDGEIEDDETADNKQMQQETEMLNSLTGIPFPDDVLLYCVPVCAPWNSLINYKYKVKLTPGTCKRGKASKMAISAFMQDKTTSTLERDLLRSVKDTDLSRNMPGKVKVSITKNKK